MSGSERKEERKVSILEPGLDLNNQHSCREKQQQDAPPYEHYTVLGKIFYYKTFTSRH